jgi:S-formylglutathione hydrolase FrmB
MIMKHTKRACLLIMLVGAVLLVIENPRRGMAQVLVAKKGPHSLTVERIKVHGKSLEGNLAGDSPDREVAVLLPPSYAAEKARHYPVVYVLHGFSDKLEGWFGSEQHWINLPIVVGRAFAEGTAEMIIVMPDAYTRFEGSMYSSSVTTGDWESYIASELVAFVDSHYRTIRHAASRGIAGHSMGGYGALRIGIRHPDVFSTTYALNPCCLTLAFAVPQDAEAATRMEAVRTFADLAKADLGIRAAFASAAAWSPNPKNPPFFIDLPWHDGARQPMVIAKWTANRPLFMLDQNVANLRKLRGIGFDGGNRDIPPNIEGVKILDDELNANGIAHAFELYDGDHTSSAAARLEKVVLPFLAQRLEFGSTTRPH